MAKRYIADKFEGGEFIGVNSATITTAVSITNATLTDGGYTQQGKVVLIANGANVINYTVNAGITASFVKGGTGAITFVQGAGRTLVSNSGSFVWNGLVNGTVQISSFGTTDILTFVSQSLYPAPFIDIIVPDSTLPSTTGNFELYGAFFKEDMVVTFTGQTVNYIIFHSDNHISVNVTTGATEGLFSITLNNGISKTFANAYMIVLGTVFTPLTAEWTLIEPIDVADDEVYTQTYGSVGSAIWSKQFDWTKNISIRFKLKQSPLGSISFPFTSFLQLIKVSDSAVQLNCNVNSSYGQVQFTFGNSGYLDFIDMSTIGNYVFEFRYVTGVSYFYVNGVLKTTFSSTLSENVKLKVLSKYIDIIDIKYIELA